ncbi:hypothetical protein DC522_20215 [Microvirga sp. KLBC 81]|nr:hypothetical protein DC522_20215 [Microvirga sp. KLBC 81]
MNQSSGALYGFSEDSIGALKQSGRAIGTGKTLHLAATHMKAMLQTLGFTLMRGVANSIHCRMYM